MKKRAFKFAFAILYNETFLSHTCKSLAINCKISFMRLQVSSSPDFELQWSLTKEVLIGFSPLWPNDVTHSERTVSKLRNINEKLHYKHTLIRKQHISRLT